jgi:hypothetical protein
MSDLDRRRSILLRAIGERLCLKRGTVTTRHPLHGLAGVLTDVRRTKCTLRFDELHDRPEWNVPIAAVWLPYSVEPLSGQQELFS